MFANLLVLIGLAAQPIWAASGSPHAIGQEEAMGFQRDQLTRLTSFLGPELDDQAVKAPPATITFKNPAARKFLVDGTKIPDGAFISMFYALFVSESTFTVNWDAGPSWSGLMPISADQN